jgi:hypothetical protein
VDSAFWNRRWPDLLLGCRPGHRRESRGDRELVDLDDETETFDGRLGFGAESVSRILAPTPTASPGRCSLIREIGVIIGEIKA